jgi:hypothetical protein
MQNFAVRFDPFRRELALDVTYEFVDEKFSGLFGLPDR